MAEVSDGGVGPGCIPYRVRLGVAGHRKLERQEEISALVRKALAAIRERIPSRDHTPVWLTIVSPLAEGADRLVVHEVLQDPSADLEAILPLPRREYEEDFPSSSDEFSTLFERASIQVELPNPAPWEEDVQKIRTKAYRQVGRYIVDHSDILIVLWDGEGERGVGGTAEVVRYAEKRKTPMLWVNTRTFELHEQRLENVQWDALDALERFNGESIPAFAQEMEKRSRKFHPGATPAMQSVPLGSLCDWFLPYFVRADVLAGRYQKRHHSLATPIFVLSAAAVGFAGAQAVFFPNGKNLLYGEVACILALIGVVTLGLRWRPSRRWIAYRFLAERLRSGFFLAAAGLDDRSAPQPQNVNVDAASAGWLSRAYVEVWKKRGRVRPAATDVPALRNFLVTSWVRSQAEFHRTRSEENERAHRRLKAAIWTLLALTLAAPLVHIFDLLEGDWPHRFSFLSISLPAVGAAVTGFGEQREYELLAERYKRMNVELENAAVHMLETEDIEEVWSVAARTEALMREENRDWFGLMRFRDIAPHV